MPEFKIPENIQSINQWHKQDNTWFVQEKDSLFAPRFLSFEIGPEFGISSFQEVLDYFEEYVAIDLKQAPILEKLEAYEKWYGADFRISLTPTSYDGVNGVLYLYISKLRDKKNYIIMGLEMTETTFRDWGGIARFLTLLEIINDPSDFPKERLTQIANAPLKGQVKLYEETLNVLQQNLVKPMVSLTPKQIVNNLKNLNYDRILND